MVTVQDFIRSIGSRPPALVYLFCPFKSPKAKAATFESFLADRALQAFVKTYVDPGLKDLCYSAYFADEADVADVVMTAQTMPFLAERRVSVIHNAEHYDGASAPQRLLEYLNSPSETTVLLMVANRVDKRSKFYKACEKAGEIVECGALRESEVAQWVRAEVEALGKTIDSAAVQQLIARTGTHLSDVHNAVTTLVSYVGPSDAIHPADVQAACADVAEEEVWALTDAIAVSDTGKALQALRNITELGKDPSEIMGTINWLLKSAYAVAAAGDAGAPAVNPFVAQKVAPLVKKLGLRKLRAAFHLCIETELMLRSTGVNRKLALELLVVKLAVPAPRRRSA